MVWKRLGVFIRWILVWREFSLSSIDCWFHIVNSIYCCCSASFRPFAGWHYRFEREDFVVVVVALLLCWLLVREMLCKIPFNRPSITHQKNHVIFHNFFSSCVLSSLCLFFFLINMHNNAESEQFKCTQRLAHSVAVIDYSKWASNMHFVSKMKQNYWLNIAHTDIHSQTHRTHQRLWIAWEILNEWKWIRLKVNSISISEVFLSHSITMKLETI